MFYTLVYSEATLLPTYLGHTGTTIHYDEDTQVTQYRVNHCHSTLHSTHYHIFLCPSYGCWSLRTAL